MTPRRSARANGARTLGILALGALASGSLAGCVGGTGSEYPVVTFQVAGDETYKIELITPELEQHARSLLAGEPLAAIPLGTVVRDDPGVNAPWSWHIDPATLEFADMTIEVCDGIPSYVEDGTITSDEFCPWSAKVIDVTPAD